MRSIIILDYESGKVHILQISADRETNRVFYELEEIVQEWCDGNDVKFSGVYWMCWNGKIELHSV
jgi:hypothetical protein